MLPPPAHESGQGLAAKSGGTIIVAVARECLAGLVKLAVDVWLSVAAVRVEMMMTLVPAVV
jgi:hypothetical protein